jgi:predicted N-acetyltransferase YhbS
MSWVIRPATREDREAALALSQRAFGTLLPDAKALWSWQFLEPAWGKRMYYFVADSGSRLIGQSAAWPVQVQHQHRTVLGLLSVSSSVDPEFNGRGVFPALARRLFTDAESEAPLVFGFPNQQAAPVYYGRLNFVELRPLPLLVLPLGKLRRVLATWKPRLKPVAALFEAASPLLRLAAWVASAVAEARGAQVVPLTRFEAWSDELWASLAPELGTCIVRNAQYLQWRYCHSPFPYARYQLQRHGRAVGFAVSRLVPWRGGSLAHLMELMVPRHDYAGARALVGRVILDAMSAGASAICAIATARHPHRAAMLASGMLPLRGPLIPKLSFGVRINGPGVVPNRLLHVDDWYVSGSDLDYL